MGKRLVRRKQWALDALSWHCVLMAEHKWRAQEGCKLSKDALT